MRGPSASQASGRRLPGRNRSAGPHSKEFCSPEFQGGSMRFRTTILISVLLAATGLAHAAEETPLLANSPTVSKTQVVFAYGGYLCSVPPAPGGVPHFSTRGAVCTPGVSAGLECVCFTGRH